MQPGHNTTETSCSLWSAALNIPEGASKSRGRVKKSDTIHHPEFEKSSYCVEDPFWKAILHDCARKKFPRGFVYTDRFLKHRTNNISIALPDDPAAIAQTAIYFFQENGKLYSKQDQEIRKKRDEANILAQLATRSNDWSRISKSKNRRSTYIRDYVERKYPHLLQTVRDELYTQLNVAFETKYITKDHVYFEAGQIRNIDGIDANANGIVYTRALPPYRLSTVIREELPKDESYRHYENWCKFLTDYRKYIISSAKSSHTVQTSVSLSSECET